MNQLTWATTTTYRTGKPTFEQFDPRNERVKARNRIAAEFIAREGIPTDDLYSLIENHPEYSAYGIHYKPAGTGLQVKQVAQSISRALGK